MYRLFFRSENKAPWHFHFKTHNHRVALTELWLSHCVSSLDAADVCQVTLYQKKTDQIPESRHHWLIPWWPCCRYYSSSFYHGTTASWSGCSSVIVFSANKATSFLATSLQQHVHAKCTWMNNEWSCEVSMLKSEMELKPPSGRRLFCFTINCYVFG